MRYKFTIFTPCFNGSNTIHRVFDSVLNQSYNNWEWIIINDGSTDNSDHIIRSLISMRENHNEEGEKIIYLKQPNMGKHRAWNKAVSIATGDFFVPADCDDSFVPETLEFFNNKANLLKGDDFIKSNLSGISVCCYNPDSNELVGSPFPDDGILSNDLELKYKYNVKGEKWGCVRLDLLKQRLFPQINAPFFFESYIWFDLALKGYLKANYNKLIRAYYYEPNSLTNNKKNSLNYNRAHMQFVYRLWYLRKINPIVKEYSRKAYFREYLIFIRTTIKYFLSRIHDFFT